MTARILWLALVQGWMAISMAQPIKAARVPYGSIFKMTTNGSVTGLYGFTGGNDGGYPLPR